MEPQLTKAAIFEKRIRRTPFIYSYGEISPVNLLSRESKVHILHYFLCK